MESQFSLPDPERELLKEQDFVLSAKDLVSHGQVPSVIPCRGPKEQHPDGSPRQNHMVQKRQEQRHTLIKTQRVAKVGNLSVGEWEPDKELVVVRTHKGKFWHTMGYMLQGGKYLYPEEGLFLLEVGSMELHYGGVPLSIQRAYSLLIPTYLSKEHYKVYCHLMRLGYITTRHIECDITDYEYRLHMHQYRHTQNMAYHKVQGWFKQLGDEPMNSIWPDSDSNPGSLPSISMQSGFRRSKMSPVNSNANTHNSNSNSVEQSGCDSSEVGSAGEMSQLMKARQKVHRTGGRENKQGKEKMVMSEENLRAHAEMSAKDNQEREEADESPHKLKKRRMPIAMDTSESPCEPRKRSPEPDDAAMKTSKNCEFVEPGEPMDNLDKCTNMVKESDESSVYSDGPVYPEDMEIGKGSPFDQTSLSLLDFHKRRLNGSSEEGSKKHKRPKLSGSESDSSREKRSSQFPSPVSITRPPTPPLLAKKRALDDSGKETHSDLDQEFQQTRTGKKRLKQNYKMVLKQGKKHERSLSSDLGLSDTASSTSVDLEEFLDMMVPILHGNQKGSPGVNEDNIQTYLQYPQWNFDKILLPDIATSVKTSHLPFPAKELVPESIATSRCINDLETVEGKQAQLTQLCNNNKLLLAKSKKIINVLEHIGDGKGKITDSKNASMETSTKEPDNWKEYKEKQQQDEQNLTELLNSPVSHLWNNDVKPLVKPSDAKSTGHVLNKLQVIHGANLTSEHSGQRFSPPLVECKVAFDVFLPDKKYKKTNPGQPNLCVVVCSEEDPVPELATQLDLLMKAAPVPLVWAVVDNTDINFYTLNDIELPVDITMG